MTNQKTMLSDAEKHDATQMNAAPRQEAKTLNQNGVKVLFLGNSITLHGKLPEIGWFNEWGMAASTLDKDYAHIVIKGIEQKTGRKADVRIRNLADFERNFKTYDYSQNQDLMDFKPDYLIIALGENVAYLEKQEERQCFQEAFKKLLEGFLPGRSKPNTVVRGCFWTSDWKDEIMAHVASDLDLPFVKANLDADPSMMAIGLFEHKGVQQHPSDKGMAAIAEIILEGLFPQNSGYSVYVDGKSVPVRPIRVSAQPFNQWAPGYQRPIDQTEIAGMTQIISNGPIVLQVTAQRPFKKAKIRPLKTKIVPEINNQDIRFTLPGPGYYVLELDDLHNPLEIFVEPERDFTQERQEANIVFGPGIHEPVILKLKSHDRVFLDKDAYVLASFQIDNATDVKISGYGTICGSRNRRVGDYCYREGMDGNIRIIDSHKVTIDGPIVLDSSCWCVSAFNSSDLDFSHMKVTGAWRYNTDGIDICNSQCVHIHDCYVHSFDDAIVIKGNYPASDCKDPIEDVLVEHCVCWCGWGKTLEIGLETFAPYYRNIVFQDCDLIHNSYGALGVDLGGYAPIDDITFRDIRIEYSTCDMKHIMQKHRDEKVVCPSPYAGVWLTVQNAKMFRPGSMYQNLKLDFDPATSPHGTFKSLTVEDIAISVEEGAVMPGMGICSEPGSTFGKVTLSNITLNGQCYPLGVPSKK